MCFHAVLRKNEEEVWSLVKIAKLISIALDSLFEGMLHNIRYNVVRANNVAFDITIADFPLMNVNGLITSAMLMGNLRKTQIIDKTTCILGYGHIKTILDAYFANLALIDIYLSTLFN